jgi:hypothetical protein
MEAERRGARDYSFDFHSIALKSPFKSSWFGDSCHLNSYRLADG